MDRIVDIATDSYHLTPQRSFMMFRRNVGEVGRIALDDNHAVIVHAHGVT